MSYPVHLVTDANGWIRGARITDGPMPGTRVSGEDGTAGGTVTPPPATHVRVESIDLAQQALQAKGLARLHPDRRSLMIPQDDRRAWKLFRGHGRDGFTAHQLLTRIRELRQQVVADLPPEVPDLPIPAPRALPTVPYLFAEVPGLVLRPTVVDDLEGMAQAGVDGGLYTAVCPPGATCGCTPPEAHAWLHLARRIDTGDSWAMTTEFQGRPLQFEIVREMQPGDVTFTYTVHLTRERPHWFWREAERPVFEGLRQHGIKAVYSTTRSDRPDWIQALKDNYGAEEVEQHAKTVVLRYPLATIDGRFTGWPARKQVGFNQTLGRVRVWEATAADLPALHQLIDDTVPIPRKVLAHRVAEEWWHLDRATLLLGARDGVLRYARAIRPRRGLQGALTFLSGLFDEPELEGSARLVLQWAKQAGYTTLTSFVQAGALDAGGVPMLRQARGMRIVKEHTRFREPFTEIEFDVP